VLDFLRNFRTAFSMPIRACLDGHKKFDDETIRRMGIAFETALALLGGTRA
jgi:hypothetical protein